MKINIMQIWLTCWLDQLEEIYAKAGLCHSVLKETVITRLPRRPDNAEVKTRRWSTVWQRGKAAAYGSIVSGGTVV